MEYNPVYVTTSAVRIQGGFLRKPWFVNSVEEDGKSFIPLNSSDSKLSVFCSGVLRKRGWNPIDTQFFPDIKKLRNDAIERAMAREVGEEPPAQVALFDTSEPMQAKKRRRLTPAILAQLPRVVTIQLPALTGHMPQRAISADVLVENGWSKAVRIEASPTVLEYVRQAILDSPRVAERSTIIRSRTPGVFFDPRGNQWCFKYLTSPPGQGLYYRLRVRVNRDDPAWDRELREAEDVATDEYRRHVSGEPMARETDANDDEDASQSDSDATLRG